MRCGVPAEVGGLMTARMTDDQLSEARDKARCKADDKAYDRLCRRYDAAEPLIGELCREGRQVFYINLRTRSGKMTGRIKEGPRGELISYLIRNRYV